MRRSLTVLAGFALALTILYATMPNAAANPDQRKITVFAAASMKDAIQTIAGHFQNHCDCKITLSVAGTGTLARQLANGAPADIFISADQRWMSWLVAGQSISGDDIRIIAENRLALVAAKSNSVPGNPLALMLKARFAMAEPDSVPAGRYAKAALIKQGLWEQVRGNAVFTENVRVALAMAARGDVGAAIVYRSDLSVESRVVEAYEFDARSHDRIGYPAALTPKASPLAEKFLDYLTTDAAQAIFVDYGFATITGNDTNR